MITPDPQEGDEDSSMSLSEHIRECAARAGARITSENAALLTLLHLRLTDDPFVE